MAINNLKIRKKNFLPIVYQDRMIRQLFPQFIMVKGNHIKATWEGELQPDKEMRKHKVIIEYKLGENPKVSIPTWVGKSKHKYKEDLLCLYYKNWQNWNGHKLIANTIIPWISQWLLFNEFYKLTDNFAALEVRH